MIGRKNRIRAVVVMFLLIVVLLGVTAIMPTAFGATYSGDLEGSGALANGKAEAQISAGLSAKIAEVNAKIVELNTAGTALSDAYAAGTIPAYSNIDGSNGLITSDNRRSGYKSDWEGLFIADLKRINAGYNGWGDNSVAWISYDAVNDTGYIVAGKFAEYLGNNQKVGSPVGDRFIVAGNHYQNFTGGYLKSVGGTTACTVVYKKNYVETESEVYGEVAADGNATGLVGAIRKDSPLLSSFTSATINNKFMTKYAALKAGGFNVGSPSSPVNTNGAFADGLYVQQFWNGDSASVNWGDGRQNWAWLVLNQNDMNVYLIKDEFTYGFEGNAFNSTKKAAFKALGAPVSDVFVFDGNRYQNFENGYAKVTGTASVGGTATEINSRTTTKSGFNMQENGTERSLDPSENVGVLNPTVTGANMPEGVTEAELSAMFTDKFDDIKTDYAEVVPKGLVGKSGDLISQTYSAKVTEASSAVDVMIAYDFDSKTVHFLNAASTATFKNYSNLLYPTTDILTVAQGSTDGTKAIIKVQGFKTGYIRIVSTKQYDDDFNEYYEDKGFATVGSTYNDEFAYFENINYVETVGVLNTATSGDSRAPSYAYNGGAGSGGVDLKVPQGAELTQAFKDAYMYYWDLGFSVGQPDTQGIVWWVSGQSGVVKQGYKGGNGTGNLWGDNSMLVYDADNGVVRLVTDNIATKYANDGASGNGWPISEMMYNAATNMIVQNFNVIDPVMTSGRKVHFVANLNTGVTTKVEGSWYDFDVNTGYVEYLTQYSASTVTKLAVTAPTKYDLGATATINFADYVDNSQRWTVIWDTDVEIGTLTEAGVWTYTGGAEPETVTVSVDFYTAFEKLNFTLDLRFGEAAVSVDKTALQAKYDAVKGLKESDYTAASWTAFNTSLTAAKAVLDDADATQEAVDAALNALSTAHTGLVAVPPVVTADKAALQAKYDAVKGLKEADYTADSWTAFNTSLTAAKAVLDSTTVSQEDVDAALSALNTAHNGLVSAKKKGNGCGSAVGLSGGLTAVGMLVLAMAVLFRKRRTN